MTTFQLNEVKHNVLDKELNVAEIIAKLTEDGYIPNKNKEVKLQWSIILLGAFRNIRLFNQDVEEKLINFFINFNRL